MVQKHSTLNYTKGTIRSKRYIDIDDNTLIAEMKKDHAVDLYKAQRKELREILKTGAMILAFDTCNPT